jgi:hypothetical protein
MCSTSGAGDRRTGVHPRLQCLFEVVESLAQQLREQCVVVALRRQNL